MVLGAITHVALWVSDRPRSEAFYERVLGLLGYRRTAQTDQFTTWWSPRAGAITLSPLPSRDGSSPPILPGLHHLAFSADSRDQVDAFYRHLQTLGIPVLKAPSAPSPETLHQPNGTQDSLTSSALSSDPASRELGHCYAVLFKDPDGLCLELVYMATE